MNINTQVEKIEQLSKKTSQPDFDYTLKLIIIGDSGVGKSSIMTRYNQNKFIQNYMMTIGINYVAKTVLIEDKRIRLQIWDTAGQQKYKTITQNYYRNSQGAIVTFSINSKQSFSSVRTWIDQLSQTLTESIQVILVGTKKDLQDERQVLYSQAQQFAVKNSISYIECSAKNGDSINQVFMTIGKMMKRKQIDEKISQLGSEQSATRTNKLKVVAISKNLHARCCESS